MDFQLTVTKLVLATFPLLGPSLGSASPATSVDSSAEVNLSGGNCERFAYAVNCHANVNYPDSHYYYECFPTLCDAMAAGAYQCRKRFKGTCEPMLEPSTGSFEAGPPK
jgi:hypothetical protein